MKLQQHLAIGYIRSKFKLLSAISKKKTAEKAFELFCTPQTRNNKKLPEIFVGAEKLHFILDGNVVRGWRFRVKKNDKLTEYSPRKKVLILHGYESSVINFEQYIKPLTQKGYEVLAFDAPAHGISEGKKINAPLYCKMVKEIHSLFGPVQSYIAHSFGGLAVSMALEEVNHTTDYKLVLIAPAAETTTAIDSFFRFLKLDNSVRKEFEKVIIKEGGESPAWYSIKRSMKHIKAATLWVQDEDDEITPMSDVLKIKAENYPNIQFVFTKGLGHRRIYRDSKVRRTIIDFL